MLQDWGSLKIIHKLCGKKNLQKFHFHPWSILVKCLLPASPRGEKASVPSPLCHLALQAQCGPRQCFPYVANRCSLEGSKTCFGEKFSFKKKGLKSQFHSYLPPYVMQNIGSNTMWMWSLQGVPACSPGSPFADNLQNGWQTGAVSIKWQPIC